MSWSGEYTASHIRIPPASMVLSARPKREAATGVGVVTLSSRAARELRDVLGERLRRELDSFRERQIRVEGRCEILDRQPELDRERRLRDHLARLGGEDVRTDDLLGGAVRHELDEPSGVPRCERARHVLERQLRYEW